MGLELDSKSPSKPALPRPHTAFCGTVQRTRWLLDQMDRSCFSWATSKYMQEFTGTSPTASITDPSKLAKNGHLNSPAQRQKTLSRRQPTAWSYQMVQVWLTTLSVWPPKFPVLWAVSLSCHLEQNVTYPLRHMSAGAEMIEVDQSALRQCEKPACTHIHGHSLRGQRAII